MMTHAIQSIAPTSAATHGGYDPAWFDVLAEVEERHFWFRARNRVIAATVAPLVSGMVAPRILEVGCGNGNVLRMLRELCPRAEVTGLDLFEEGLEHARRRCRDCTLVAGSIFDSPFPENAFDLIGMFDVLEHLDDDRGALRALYSILKPGGAVVLSVPACPNLWSYFDEAAGHYRRYEKPGLMEKFSAAGFEISYVTHFMTTILPLVWAARRFNGRAGKATAANSFRSAQTELKIRPVSNFLLTALLKWESAWIAREKTLPIGTSLLVVARKTAKREVRT